MATNQFSRSHSGYGSLDIVAGLCAAVRVLAALFNFLGLKYVHPQPCISPTREYGNWPLLSELGGMGPGSPASSATYSTPSPPATASPRVRSNFLSSIVPLFATVILFANQI
jgi:hypothetical protein